MQQKHSACFWRDPWPPTPSTYNRTEGSGEKRTDDHLSELTTHTQDKRNQADLEMSYEVEVAEVYDNNSYKVKNQKQMLNQTAFWGKRYKVRIVPDSLI